MKSEQPYRSLNRRGFLKIAFEALQIGVPVGIFYYLFVRVRSYLMLTEALDRFTFEVFPSPEQSQSSDSFAEGWNNPEITNLEVQETVETQSSGQNSKPVEQVEAVPQPLQLIHGFILGDSHYDLINLADNERHVMAFIVTNGNTVIPTSRAAPYAYSRKAVRQDVFETSNLSVLSFLGTDDDEGLCTWAHSGILSDGRRLFADYLERGIRVDSHGKSRTTSQSIHFIEKELLGASIYLLQESQPGILPYNPPGGFKLEHFKQGNILQLRVNAAARVSNQAVEEYNKHVNGTASWLHRKPRNVWQEGWSQYNPRSSWILRTCLGTSADEPGFFNISNNRLILMFEPVIALRDPVFDPRKTQG